MPEPLLTPQEVADLLQISIKSVYRHKNRLGGFYPAGIGSLRFSPEAINGVLAGQRQGVAVSVRAQGEGSFRPMVQDKNRGPGRKSRAPEAGEISEELRKRATRI